jgi:predicted unusual protein kinase regulating ubiquinone biosynthesis (AarF/ABC1/UbiB family)
MAERQRGTGRIARSTKLGGVAAGAAARAIGTKAANRVRSRSEDEADEAMARQALETADRLVTVLSTMKGAAMKLGQTFSVIDLGLVPPEHREAFQAKLAKLQASAEPHPFKEIRKVVEQDLGEKLSANFDDFSEEPIAAASIGQVHRATTVDGRDVAVKVQYPGIKDAVRADMQNLGIGLKLLSRISPGLDTKEILQEIRERIGEELDYEHEATNHRAMARAYRGHPFVVVPDVITDLCRERVIVTEYVDGRRFEEILRLPQDERSRFGEILGRFYVNGPLRHRLLNGDPHPGNSLFLADGRVAFIDFGFFKHMTAEEAEVQRQTLQAVHEHDDDVLFELMRAQGVVTGRRDGELEQLRSIYDALCGWLFVDEEYEITPRIVTKAIVEQGKMSRSDVKLPADQIVAARAYVLVLAILGQLRAKNNWSRVAREVIYGDPPVTELGRAEAEWLGNGRPALAPA